MTTLTPGKLWGMRRMADAKGRFKMTAVDQRPPIVNPIAAHHGGTAPWEAVARFKRLLIETLHSQSSAMLLDPNYAIPHGIDALPPSLGLIVTLEDSRFEETAEGRLSREIDGWSVGKIRRMGADAVKVLAWYRPDAALSIRQKQQDFARRIGDACRKHDIPYLFELLVYPLAFDAERGGDYVEMQSKRADHVLASVEAFSGTDFGIDVFKLESPVAAANVPAGGEDRTVQALFDEMGRIAGRPWVMLSAGAGKSEFRDILVHAYSAGASGYLAGRAIWMEPFAHYPDWNAMRAGLLEGSLSYMKGLNTLTDERALPFHEHPVFGPGGAKFPIPRESFRHEYGES